MKKYLPTSLAELFLLLYLLTFPFAQLSRFQINFEIGYAAVYLSDVWVILFVLVRLFKVNRNLINANKDLISFISILMFSFLISVFAFGFSIFPGLGYLVRLIFYLLFWMLLTNFKSRFLKINVLAIILTCVAVVGLIQYLSLPDLRALYYFGWDDHLNRLAGTFLDPGFTSLFLTFGFLITLTTYLKNKKIIYLLASLLSIVTLGLTYARAGYLAATAGFLFVLIKNKNYAWIILGLLTFAGLILILPNKEGEGTNLKRLYSLNLRIQNYQDTWEIVKVNPLFGVGYSNLCEFKVKETGYKDIDSHSCSGSDNGLLLILATSGVVGMISFLNFLVKTIKNTSYTYYGNIFLACGFALLVHTQFVNSIFYPWSLGIMGILYCLSRKNETDKE